MKQTILISFAGLAIGVACAEGHGEGSQPAKAVERAPANDNQSVHASHFGEVAGAVPVRLPTGQYITPTALPNSVQQFLNPGLPAYPKFVAGEAVRSQLSPDGTTLAILCAGHNSLEDQAGNPDLANSTQYIFLYDVSGTHKQAPLLTQVIKQTNAHVGLAFSPAGQLYASGGVDDAVYVYAKAGNSWSMSRTINLGHAKKGIGIGVAPNASGLGISADGKTLVVANNYNDSISVVDAATGAVRYEHDLRPFFANNEGKSGGVGGTYPFAVVVKGNAWDGRGGFGRGAARQPLPTTLRDITVGFRCAASQ